MHENRLKWALRRGMLELDLFLGAFYEKAFPSLSPNEKSQFAVLLEASDTQLQLWLLGQETHADTTMRNLIDKIRALKH